MGLSKASKMLSHGLLRITGAEKLYRGYKNAWAKWKASPRHKAGVQKIKNREGMTY